MATGRDLPHHIGDFIRELRRNARISLRQLADQAGVSNPYLSQIERGLRKPSAEVLQQLAGALRVSTALMYLRAGLLEGTTGQGVLAAIAADADLTTSQKQALTQIYETFRRENSRAAADQPPDEAGNTAGDAPGQPAQSTRPANSPTARQAAARRTGPASNRRTTTGATSPRTGAPEEESS